MTSSRPNRSLLLAFALIALVGAGVVGFMRLKPFTAPVLPPSIESPIAAIEIGPDERLDVTREPAQVFQKALWRRPAADDLILHAERREIADAEQGDLKTWRWFLAVQPGPELLAWLDTNPFSLTPVPSSAVAAGAMPPPEWFPRDLSGFAKRQNTEGRLVFWYSAEQNLLYASDSGFGFNDAQRAL
jgi:hypothetical protein